MSPYLLHVTPNICIVFLLYENITCFAGQLRTRLKAEIAAEKERIHQLQIMSSQQNRGTAECSETEVIDLSDRTGSR